MPEANYNAIKQLIPKQFAIDNKVIPVSVDDGVLTVAMVNPNDLQLIDAIEFITFIFTYILI